MVLQMPFLWTSIYYYSPLPLTRTPSSECLITEDEDTSSDESLHEFDSDNSTSSSPSSGSSLPRRYYVQGYSWNSNLCQLYTERSADKPLRICIVTTSKSHLEQLIRYHPLSLFPFWRIRYLSIRSQGVELSDFGKEEDPFRALESILYPHLVKIGISGISVIDTTGVVYMRTAAVEGTPGSITETLIKKTFHLCSHNSYITTNARQISRRTSLYDRLRSKSG